MNEEVAPFKRPNDGLRRFGPCLRGKVLILEGLISAGKSTAGQELIRYVTNLGIKCKFFPEPIIPGLLQLFLSDQKQYAFAFQLAMLVKRQSIYREAYEYAAKGYFCIIDRSLHGDYCFALLHHSRGNISDKSENIVEPIVEGGYAIEKGPSQWKAYLEVLHGEQFEHPDYVVYLEVSPETAIKRCASRDRKGEGSYDRKYFEELCNVYSSVIPSSPAKSIIVLDWNAPRTTDDIALPLLLHLKSNYDGMF